MDCNMESLMTVCKYLATAILENGGETYRAEECIVRLCSRFGFDDVDVIAFPTGVMLSVRDSEKHCYSETCRVKKRSFNLKRLNDANDISRKVVEGEMSLFEAEKIFASTHPEAASSKRKLRWINLLAGGLSSGFFAVLFGGIWLDFIAAALCGALIQLFLIAFKRMDIFHFISTFVGSVIATVFAIGFVSLFHSANLSLIVIGAIMPLFPGLPMTNAIRDTINGDLISGISRFGEVLLVAVCIASGVGVVLAGYVGLGGQIVEGGVDRGFVVETVKAVVFCFFATSFFSILLCAPGRSILPASAIAAVGYYVYFVFSYFGLSIYLGGFLGTLFIALAGEILARIMKMPSTIFVFPAIIALVPGIWLYRTMLFLVHGEYASFASKGTETLLFAGVMAAAIAVVNFVFRTIAAAQRNRINNKKRG